jgi:lysozyme
MKQDYKYYLRQELKSKQFTQSKTVEIFNSIITNRESNEDFLFKMYTRVKNNTRIHEKDKTDQFFIELIKHQEGFRSEHYYCTSNKLSIGFGRNVIDNPLTREELIYLGFDDRFKVSVNRIQAEYLLKNDMEKFYLQLQRKIPFYNSLDKEAQYILLNMAFNMGTKTLMKFIGTLTLIKNGDYKQASFEMLDSRWSKQVGNRSVQLSILMENIK